MGIWRESQRPFVYTGRRGTVIAKNDRGDFADPVAGNGGGLGAELFGGGFAFLASLP